MAYTRINWQDLPSTSTPRNATNLNKMDSAIKEHDDKLLGNTSMGNVVVDSIRSKNMLDFSTFSTQTLYGVTFTNNGNGSITINGTANQDFGVSFIQFKIKAGQYYLSTNASATTTNAFYLYDHDENVGYGYGSITLNNDHNNMGFDTWITNGTSFSNVIIQPQLETGTIATSYSPYQELDNQENYSTSEQKIGIWIDGKTLYRKVVLGTLVDGDLIVDLTSLDIYEMIKVEGFCGNQRPLNFYFSGYSVSTRFTGGYMYIFASTPYANDNFKMIIEYTKTTD